MQELDVSFAHLWRSSMPSFIQSLHCLQRYIRFWTVLFRFPLDVSTSSQHNGHLYVQENTKDNQSMLTFATLVFPQPGGPYSITPEQVGLFNFVVSSGSCIWRWNKQVNWPWSCKDKVPWNNFQSHVKELVLLIVWRLRGISTAKVNRSHHTSLRSRLSLQGWMPRNDDG